METRERKQSGGTEGKEGRASPSHITALTPNDLLIVIYSCPATNKTDGKALAPSPRICLLSQQMALGSGKDHTGSLDESSTHLASDKTIIHLRRDADRITNPACVRVAAGMSHVDKDGGRERRQ